MTDWTLVQVLAVIFLATVIRSAFGFGEALIAVPLLAFVMPIKMATPLAVLVSVTVAAVVVIQDWRHIHLRSAWWLVLPTLFGIPLGLWGLKVLPELTIKTILGVFLIAFSTYSLLGRQPYELKNDRHAWAFGFVAGVLGGAYGVNGPPLVIYGTLRRWSPEYFRATLQGYFLPASLVGMFGFWREGLWVPDVTRYYLLSLPVALVAIFLGRVVHYRLKGRSFLVYVHTGLIIIGSSLLIEVVWKAIAAA